MFQLKAGPPLQMHYCKSCNAQKEALNPVVLGMEMNAVLLIVVGPRRAIWCLTAPLFLLLLETQRVCTVQVSEFFKAT